MRVFDGVAGPDDKVLRRTNDKGWDLSNTIANQVEDFMLGRKGVMRRRIGSRKILDTGRTNTITAILPIRCGGALAYGVISGGALDVITMPRSLKSRTSVVDMSPVQDFGTYKGAVITVFPGEFV
jgi:hypothetical protein